MNSSANPAQEFSPDALAAVNDKLQKVAAQMREQNKLVRHADLVELLDEHHRVIQHPTLTALQGLIWPCYRDTLVVDTADMIDALVNRSKIIAASRMISKL